MKILFKFIFFILLFFKVSNATASNYIYILNRMAHAISICSTTSSTGHIQTCKDISPDDYNFIGNLTHITISPDGAYAYIATHNSSYILRCKVRDIRITNCEPATLGDDNIPRSIAYLKLDDSPSITLHFKPKVESN